MHHSVTRQTFSMIRMSAPTDLMLFVCVSFSRSKNSYVLFLFRFYLPTRQWSLVINSVFLVNAGVHRSLTLSTLSLLHVTNALALACSYCPTRRHQAARKTQCFRILCDRATLSFLINHKAVHHPKHNF